VKTLEQKTREKADGTAIFLGTVPLRTNGFVFADRYRIELHDPGSGRRLSYTYQTERTEETAK
jgi:hypothetical protein